MKPLSRTLFGALILLVLASCKTTSEQEKAESTPSTPAVETAPDVPAAPATTTDASGRTVTASGLRYKVLTSGPADGRSPTINDSVTVHYRGTLTDGTVFDSSVDRGEPATFGVGQVIRGWTEALQLMKPGDEWMLYIPSYLAYGPRAMGAKIPPNSDLIFQVRLLQVVGRP